MSEDKREQGRRIAVLTSGGDAAGMNMAIGCDIVIDKNLGPLILELNARPGLSIQLANNRGLLPRLNHLKDMTTRKMSIEERVSYAVNEFA